MENKPKCETAAVEPDNQRIERMTTGIVAGLKLGDIYDRLDKVTDKEWDVMANTDTDESLPIATRKAVSEMSKQLRNCLNEMKATSKRLHEQYPKNQKGGE